MPDKLDAQKDILLGPWCTYGKEHKYRRAMLFAHNMSVGNVKGVEDTLVARPKFHCNKEIQSRIHPFDYRKVTGCRLIMDIGAFEPLTYDHI